MSYWYRPKRYGYGATPNTWQGWLLTIAFIVLLAVVLEVLKSSLGGAAHIVAIAITAVLIALFIWITWKKTDGAWRWRWGPDGNER